MPLQLFLNELSAARDEISREIAVERLRALAATIRAAKQLDSILTLNASDGLNEFTLASGLPIAAIRNSSNMVDEILFLKTLQSRSPYSEVLTALAGPDEHTFEYRIPVSAPTAAGEPAKGLGLAHLFRSLGVSLPTHQHWENLRLPLMRTQMLNDAKLVEDEVQVLNLCGANAIAEQHATIKAYLRPAIESGIELWARREELFPNLAFIPRVKSQVEALLPGDPTIDSVYEKLALLESAVAEWKLLSTAHPRWPMHVRPESRRRIHLTRFADESGTIRTFSDHADFGPGEGRMHFLLQHDPERRALVGHIGRKLGIG